MIYFPKYLKQAQISLLEEFCKYDSIICLYPKYQSLFAIHANTKHIHLHLIYNNIPVWGDKQLSKILNISKMENLADLILIDMINRKMQNRAAGISPISIAKDALQILYHGYY